MDDFIDNVFYEYKIEIIYPNKEIKERNEKYNFNRDGYTYIGTYCCCENYENCEKHCEVDKWGCIRFI